MSKDGEIDYRTKRKSTHLASPDVEIEIAEKGRCIVTIMECGWETGVNVSGQKKDGYFAKLNGNHKEWLINSTNCKVLSGFAKNKGVDKYDIHKGKSWVGLTIELEVKQVRNPNGSGTVDGISVKAIQPALNKPKPNFLESNFSDAKKANATIEQIKSKYSLTTEIEEKWNTYNKEA